MDLPNGLLAVTEDSLAVPVMWGAAAVLAALALGAWFWWRWERDRRRSPFPQHLDWRELWRQDPPTLLAPRDTENFVALACQPFDLPVRATYFTEVRIVRNADNPGDADVEEEFPAGAPDGGPPRPDIDDQKTLVEAENHAYTVTASNPWGSRRARVYVLREDGFDVHLVRSGPTELEVTVTRYCEDRGEEHLTLAFEDPQRILLDPPDTLVIRRGWPRASTRNVRTVTEPCGKVRVTATRADPYRREHSGWVSFTDPPQVDHFGLDPDRARQYGPPRDVTLSWRVRGAAAVTILKREGVVRATELHRETAPGGTRRCTEVWNDSWVHHDASAPTVYELRASGLDEYGYTGRDVWATASLEAVPGPAIPPRPIIAEGQPPPG